MAAVKFPELEVNYSEHLKLPVTYNGDIVDADNLANSKGIFAMSLIPSKFPGIEP